MCEGDQTQMFHKNAFLSDKTGRKSTTGKVRAYILVMAH